MYDVTNKQTFEGLKKWKLLVSKLSEDIIFEILIANKIDNEEKRVISREQGVEFATEMKVPYFELSILNCKTEKLQGIINNLSKKII